MEDWQKRVVEERKEVYTRLEALQKFLLREPDTQVSMEDNALLRRQYTAMQSYVGILDMRIQRFPSD